MFGQALREPFFDQLRTKEQVRSMCMHPIPPHIHILYAYVHISVCLGLGSSWDTQLPLLVSTLMEFLDLLSL